MARAACSPQVCQRGSLATALRGSLIPPIQFSSSWSFFSRALSPAGAKSASSLSCPSSSLTNLFRNRPVLKYPVPDSSVGDGSGSADFPVARLSPGPSWAGTWWLAAAGGVAPLNPAAPGASFQEVWAAFPQDFAGCAPRHIWQIWSISFGHLDWHSPLLYPKQIGRP